MAPNYVRVGVRIRPPFEDEIADELAEEPGGGGWRPAVSVVEAREGQAVVRLELGEKRAREFAYDYAFGPEASQADVFDAVAAPVVDAVAAGGAHGTVFAYGQTGTGKSQEEEGEADSAYSQLDAESAYSELDDDYSQLG